MKTVFSNSELAHVWAQQNQSHGRNTNSSFFFERDIIYSYGYHYPLARLIGGVTLINSSGYSNSTAKHESHVRYAVRGQIIYVPNVKANNKESHKKNLQYFFDKIIENERKLGRARKPMLYENEIEYYKEQAKAYIQLFELRRLKAYDVFFLHNHKELTQKEVERRQKEEKKAKLIAKKKAEQSIKEWRALESNWVRTISGSDLLRVNNGHIETSRNVKITREEAQKVFSVIKSFRDKKEEFKPNGKKFTISKFYNVDKITAQGDLYAGCHTIKWNEIESIAKQLSWI